MYICWQARGGHRVPTVQNTHNCRFTTFCVVVNLVSHTKGGVWKQGDEEKFGCEKGTSTKDGKNIDGRGK
jgi:hypothetical protein